MKYINNLLTQDTVIGEVAVQGLDQDLYAGMHEITDSIGCKSHLIGMYASELSFLNTDILVQETALLIMAHDIDVLFSPTYASYNKIHKKAGTVAMRAAMQAASLQSRVIDVFELHKTGWQGNWVPSADVSNQNYTYTRHHIGAVVPAQNAERLMASLI